MTISRRRNGPALPPTITCAWCGLKTKPKYLIRVISQKGRDYCSMECAEEYLQTFRRKKKRGHKKQ